LGDAHANVSICSHELPEPNETQVEDTISKEQDHIAASLSACLVPVNVPDELTNHFDMDLSSLSFEKLVRLRFAHQTRQAATGV
jgi:putative methionine-R-sulfoxide reductase with GAF domain